jgi:hypothetical protein
MSPAPGRDSRALTRDEFTSAIADLKTDLREDLRAITDHLAQLNGRVGKGENERAAMRVEIDYLKAAPAAVPAPGLQPVGTSALSMKAQAAIVGASIIVLTVVFKVTGVVVSAVGERALDALTEPEARQIFETWYYEWPRYHRLSDARVEALLYDATITSGVRNAVVLLQRALEACRPPGPGRALACDGALGQHTLAAWRIADHGAVYRALVSERIRFFVGIALHDPQVRAFLETHPTTQLANLAGWLNRAIEFIPAPAQETT